MRETVSYTHLDVYKRQGSGRLNINILNQQQFAVVIQYHTFFNFVRSWHRKIPVVENVKNIATKYSRRAFRASGIRTFAGAKKVVLCALINPCLLYTSQK